MFDYAYILLTIGLTVAGHPLFIGTVFICVFASGVVLFHETLSLPKVIGALLIILGILLGSQG